MHIREKRKEKGLTLKELGIRIGCSESAMSQYETGKRNPDYETLLKIAEELDTSVAYLLTGSTEDQTTQTQQTNLSSDEEELVRKYRTIPDKKRFMAVVDAFASVDFNPNGNDKIKKDTEIS